MAINEALHACKIHITREQSGLRLDRCIVPNLSRTRLKALILGGQVTVNGTVAQEPAARIRTGQEVIVLVPVPEKMALPEPQEILLDVVYEDSDLIIIDKPAGMVVHPAPGNLQATVVNALLAHCGSYLSGVGDAKRPGIVHRLDKGTSGLLVVAKTELAYHWLTTQFSTHCVERAYKAVVWGIPQPPTGIVEWNIGRHPINRKKMTLMKNGGKLAATRYQVERTFGRVASLVECRPITGRTHQIRLHMMSVGHPIIGDSVYGRKCQIQNLPKEVLTTMCTFPRHALHSYFISFRHPTTMAKLHIEHVLPTDIRELINFLEAC